METIPRLIARLRRPPFNKSTQEIGDLTARHLADIFARDDEAGGDGHNIEALLNGQGVDKLPQEISSMIFKK